MARDRKEEPTSADAEASPPGLRLVSKRGTPRGRRSSRQDDQAKVRQLFNDVFRANQRDIEVVLTKCFTDPATVLACVQLLARLEGELP